MLPPLRSQSLSSWSFLTLQTFPRMFPRLQSWSSPTALLWQGQREHCSEFNYGFGEKLRQRMPMYFLNQPVLSLHVGDHWGWMKDRHCRQKLVTRGRALKGWTSSVCAGSKGSNASHINWDLSPSFRAMWSFACLDTACLSWFEITSKNCS